MTASSSLTAAVATLDHSVPHPERGLPDEVFYYISRTTPLVNVDLLINDENGRTLLSWRNDQYAGRGWHLPGGIVRLKETLEERLVKVARAEVGVDVRFEPVPLEFNQFIHHDRTNRSHFISFLYRCFLGSSFEPANRGLTPADRGYLRWHEDCPEDLLPCHRVYRTHLERSQRP